MMESLHNTGVGAVTADDTLVFPKRDSKQLAMEDIIQGLKDWRIWVLLAYQDIKLRYRRSALGPFWITLSMAITVYSMGFLYSYLFRTSMHQYYPFLVAGMLAWSLISNIIYDMIDTYLTSESLIKQIKLPYTLYIHRIAARHFIVFAHNLVVMIPIYFIFHETVRINLNTLLIIPNLIIIYTNFIIYGMLLAMIGTRFRDISQAIKSIVGVIFFVTPVMWNPAVLPQQYQNMLYLNPFYTIVELIRAPLTGNLDSPLIYTIAMLITLVGIGISAPLFTRYRARIIYWL